MPERPRILLVESSNDGTIGGSHQCLLDIARALPGEGFTPVALFHADNRIAETLRREGIETSIWVPPPAPAARGIPLLGRASEIARATAARVRVLRELRVDLLHLNNSLATSYDDWLPAAIWEGIPRISHQRMDYSPSGRRLWRLLIRQFDRVVAISDYVAGRLRDIGLREPQLVRIYDGVDASRLAERVKRLPGSVREEFGIASDAVLVVMVGHLRTWKGQDAVLRALRLLPDGVRARLRVVFVGGEGRDGRGYLLTLQRLVSESGLHEVAHFVGERADVPDLLAAADIVLHASTIPEPFGLVVVEALALGKTVVASSLGGPGEVLRDGAGHLFDPADEQALAILLERAVTNPEHFRINPQHARDRAAQFSVRSGVAALAAVYRQLLTDTKRT